MAKIICNLFHRRNWIVKGETKGIRFIVCGECSRILTKK